MWLALRRPSPHSIPLSGEEAFRNNFYTSLLLSDGNRFLVERLHKAGIEGKWVWVNRDPAPVCLPNSELRHYELQITHYYRGQVVSTTSACRFILERFIRYSWWIARADEKAQRNFNKKPLVRKARLDILQYFANQTSNDREFRTNPFDLLTELNSIRWVRSPDNDAAVGYYRMLLDSLVGSGDLRKDGQSDYCLDPRALTTLSEHEVEERRHQDNKRTQRNISILTAILAVIGLLQVGATLWTSKSQETNTPPLPSGTASLRVAD